MKAELVKQRAYRLGNLIDEVHESKHCDHDKPHKYIFYTYDECERCYDLYQELEDLYLNNGIMTKIFYYITNVPLELWYCIYDKLPWAKAHPCEDSPTSRSDIG